ncbi:hypothetical protein L211DRAFT_851626 [Terfezia boudieri ATCC MYA-4762]|uniref:Alpha/beta-hydrolase n=1 Tax=Terfezia boudieri ATCC MYA-4762 TaxID=1051890 RepID=A0A3N4LIJ2_9PEZI|nr:hypothetical protein L211DRAFT_851626 [Terfezia boudieri ATCC MYA-4762]
MDAAAAPSDISAHTYCISGIQVHVYGLDQLRALLDPPSSSSSPSSRLTSLSILHTLHPRLQTHAYMAPIIRQCLDDHYQPHAATTSGLLGISFDQRNHGAREVSPLANYAFTSPRLPHPHAHEPNPTHAMDMLGIYAGTTLDLGLIIDLLPSYLEFHFNPPSTTAPYIPLPPITQHIALGVSLGGHAAYLAALHLPKITSAIIVIGCPDYPALMLHRLKQCKLLPPTDNTISTRYLPNSFLDLITSTPPSLSSHPQLAGSPLLTRPGIALLDALAGKKLLVLSGKQDRLVPAELASGFVQSVRKGVQQVGRALFGTGAGIREVLFEGVGHEFTEGMAVEVRGFVRERMREVGPVSMGTYGSGGKVNGAVCHL